MSNSSSVSSGGPRQQRKSPLELLVIQGTPFCNISCTYCYLPNKNNKSRFELSLLTELFRQLEMAGYLTEDFSMLWHAGEPLILPVQYYRDAASIVTKFTADRCRVTQCFQTNGMLISEEFARFASTAQARVGISIDGPERIHDRHRVTRAGNGTHAGAMRGLGILTEHGVRASVIAVLTDYALDFAEELFDFFSTLDAVEIGLNVEEIEGVNSTSSLATPRARERYNHFIDELYCLWQADGRRIRIREFVNMRNSILFGGQIFSTLTHPFSILTVGVDGSYSTFSPELLGAARGNDRPFILGRLDTNSLDTVPNNQRFTDLLAAVNRGVENCRTSCEYFSACGGGSPSNKFFENGTVESTETLHCRFAKKALIDVMLPHLERETIVLN